MAVKAKSVHVSRREQKTSDKRSRIFQAAAAMFAEHGFEGTTTQQISDRAEIAAGTLFRYAATKGELLLMVYNEELRTALADGAAAARTRTDTVEAVFEMVHPLLRAAERRPENTIVYQRELLFGSPADTYRSEGLALVARLESMIAERLVADARDGGIDSERLAERARLAGRSIFAVLHLALVQPSTGAHPGHDALADLRAQIAQIIAGYLNP
ncbi:helix-turn-helix domain-containing protein [Nocardia sp. CDC153]|uniref:TetR/AcrR family transcriptional regulator n=1 Tax=Nocardia sp. CDC153 TaxID=3112167 RepID=UPI002DB7672E|nr:helix-turn-helix domain-containing protein [Nocardia sp. CDC153]MEC3956824.1 helix-turn-helix domain-containing protein [Nocardia sp. CDC153]